MPLQSPTAPMASSENKRMLLFCGCQALSDHVGQTLSTKPQYLSSNGNCLGEKIPSDCLQVISWVKTPRNQQYLPDHVDSLICWNRKECQTGFMRFVSQLNGEVCHSAHFESVNKLLWS